MGADAEYAIDVKDEWGWRGLILINADRDYRLFALLAGVRDRDGIGPLYEPRGLPPEWTVQVDRDVREEWLQYYTVENGWLTLPELEHVARVYGPPSPDLAAALGAMRALVEVGCETRFVFGFDQY